ncbi:hypothetical protein HMPREF0322_00282 [Desulfitobacterium hafniense DP7]|uniref:Uncharacterized protein n=1 Tax=Desulfitobacterium hafniense DP7 TaxID=537010 RepID=G9XH59_DESHA|nr:hypothetical protein HMPREF0322_00282 [Desulfitobacterium hafniense DP7]
MAKEIQELRIILKPLIFINGFFCVYDLVSSKLILARRLGKIA